MVACIIGSLFGSRPFFSAIVCSIETHATFKRWLVARCSVMLLAMCSDVFGALICPLVFSALSVFPSEGVEIFLDELWNSTFHCIRPGNLQICFRSGPHYDWM